MDERAAYEDLLVYWEYEDCYYQIEELEKYAVMPIPEEIGDIPDVPGAMRRQTIVRRDESSTVPDKVTTSEG